MHRTVVISFVAMTMSLTSFAQRGGCNLAVKNTNLFMKTTTVVLLLKDHSYNQAIQKAFKENWTVTPFEFAPASDLNKYMSAYGFSIVLPVSDANSTILAVLKGDRKKKEISDYTNETMIAYGEIDGLAFEPTVSSVLYRLPHMVKSMDNYIKEVKEGNINVATCEQIRLNTARYYNRKAAAIQSKTLLIDSRYEIKADLISAYPFSYKIVDRSEIEIAINNKKAGYCYLASNYIFDTKTGEVLHMSYDSPPSKKLGKGFFKELVGNIVSSR